MSPPSFTHLTDLAAERFGGKALVCSDDFFAEMDNLLKPGRGVFIPDKYTDRGKWMDGWESRRKRTEGHDWCVIQLGTMGVIHGVDIDTNYFLGNHPPFASLEACQLTEEQAANMDWENYQGWVEILPKSPLNPGSQHFFAIGSREKWTHLKLHIYPDGGVARLKVYGEVTKDWAKVGPDELIDLAAIVNGGKALTCNDEFFSHKDNINMPNRGVNMGDGWETKRNRTPGNCDWLILRLARKGTIRKIVIDTCHFKGNYPDRCKLEGCVWPFENPHLDTATWIPILSEVKLSADAEHIFEEEILAHSPITHVRLTIYPDGGVSRLRLFGNIDKDAMTLEELNDASNTLFEEKMSQCCGARAWVQKMVAARPYSDRENLLVKADEAWFSCKKEDWLEAFTHHPRIGDVESLKKKFASTATWASGEQRAVKQADMSVLQALKEYNDKYFDKFGFIFIVFATGKSAEEMLALLKERLENDPVEEILRATLEQQKITRLRLNKLVM